MLAPDVRRCGVVNHNKENTMGALQAGTAAPAFSLAAHGGDTIELAKYRGRRTVVSFLPFAFTGG